MIQESEQTVPSWTPPKPRGFLFRLLFTFVIAFRFARYAWRDSKWQGVER